MRQMRVATKVELQTRLTKLKLKDKRLNVNTISIQPIHLITSNPLHFYIELEDNAEQFKWGIFNLQTGTVYQMTLNYGAQLASTYKTSKNCQRDLMQWLQEQVEPIDMTLRNKHLIKRLVKLVYVK